MTLISDHFTTSSTITVGTQGNIVYYGVPTISHVEGVTPAGTTAGIRTSADGTKRVGLSLYFKYVKSKFSKVEKSRLKKRLDKLKLLVKQVRDTDQVAVYEALSDQLVLVVKQSEAAALGYDKFLDRAVVMKFLDIATDDKKLGSIKLSKLEDFPRVLPASAQKIADNLKNKAVFDDLSVLYLTYDTKALKTNQEKIREKDPILFGSFKIDPDKLYYITDWVDEYCDLTLEKFIDAVKAKELSVDVEKVEELDEKFIGRIVKETQERKKRLEETKQSNYRHNMLEEERAAADRKLKRWQRVVKKLFKI